MMVKLIQEWCSSILWKAKWHTAACTIPGLGGLAHPSGGYSHAKVSPFSSQIYSPLTPPSHILSDLFRSFQIFAHLFIYFKSFPIF